MGEPVQRTTRMLGEMIERGFITQPWSPKGQELERGCCSPDCLAKGEGRGKL